MSEPADYKIVNGQKVPLTEAEKEALRKQWAEEASK